MSGNTAKAPSSAQEQPIPKEAVTDRDKAELIAYAFRPYLEMALLGREDGMSEDPRQSVIKLGEEAEYFKEAAVESALNKLKSALRAAAREQISPSGQRICVLEYGSTRDDSESYQLARERFYSFLGIKKDQVWQEVQLEANTGFCRWTPSVLGLIVTETHPRGTTPSEIIEIETYDPSVQPRITV